MTRAMNPPGAASALLGPGAAIPGGVGVTTEATGIEDDDGGRGCGGAATTDIPVGEIGGPDELGPSRARFSLRRASASRRRSAVDEDDRGAPRD